MIDRIKEQLQTINVVGCYLSFVGQNLFGQILVVGRGYHFAVVAGYFVAVDRFAVGYRVAVDYGCHFAVVVAADYCVDLLDYQQCSFLIPHINYDDVFYLRASDRVIKTCRF